MSRKQWGHGFWNGVDQSQKGLVDTDDDFESVKRRLAYRILISAFEKMEQDHNKEPRALKYIINDFINSKWYSDESISEIKDALWYICKNELCYVCIGGSDDRELSDNYDYFCYSGYRSTDIIKEMQEDGICNQMWIYDSDDGTINCPYCKNYFDYESTNIFWRFCPSCAKRLYFPNIEKS